MPLRTRAEATAALARLPLQLTVTVTDDTGSPLEPGVPKRCFQFVNPDGSTGATYMSQDPDAAEIDTLADNLPVAGANRAAIKAALRAARNAAAAAKLG